MPIIFNLPGIIAAIVFIIGSVVDKAVFDHKRMIFSMVACLIIIVGDLAFRWRNRVNAADPSGWWIMPRLGAHVLFIPGWILGGIFFFSFLAGN